MWNGLHKPRLKCGHGNCYIANTLKDNSLHFISTYCLDLVGKIKYLLYNLEMYSILYKSIFFFFQVLHANINVSDSQGKGLCAMSYLFETFYNTLLLLFSHQALSEIFATPWSAACQSSLSITSWSLFQLTPIESVMPSNHLTLCCPLLLLPSNFLSIRIFSNEWDVCIM